MVNKKQKLKKQVIKIFVPGEDKWIEVDGFVLNKYAINKTYRSQFGKIGNWSLTHLESGGAIFLNQPKKLLEELIYLVEEIVPQPYMNSILPENAKWYHIWSIPGEFGDQCRKLRTEIEERMLKEKYEKSNPTQ